MDTCHPAAGARARKFFATIFPNEFQQKNRRNEAYLRMRLSLLTAEVVVKHLRLGALRKQSVGTDKINSKVWFGWGTKELDPMGVIA
jgi:hypothetical protein